MIIQTTRITCSGGSGAVLAHVLSAEKNESLEIKDGSRMLAETLFNDAVNAGVKYGFRHTSFSSKQPISDEQFDRAIKVWCREQNIPESSIVLNVEHEKKRHELGGYEKHRHILAAEFNCETKRVLPCSQYKRINEKVGRMLEVEFGHEITKGAHNRSVIAALRNENKAEISDALIASDIDKGLPAFSAYSSKDLQRAMRNDISMPAMKALVGKAFKSARPLSELPTNILISRGDKKWIAEYQKDDGSKVFIGAIARLAQIKEVEVNQKMALQPMENSYDRSITENPRRGEAPVFHRDLPTVSQCVDIQTKCVQSKNILFGNAPNDEAGRSRGDGDRVQLVPAERDELVAEAAEKVAEVVEVAAAPAKIKPVIPPAIRMPPRAKPPKPKPEAAPAAQAPGGGGVLAQATPEPKAAIAAQPASKPAQAKPRPPARPPAQAVAAVQTQAEQRLELYGSAPAMEAQAQIEQQIALEYVQNLIAKHEAAKPKPIHFYKPFDYAPIHKLQTEIASDEAELEKLRQPKFFDVFNFSKSTRIRELEKKLEAKKTLEANMRAGIPLHMPEHDAAVVQFNREERIKNDEMKEGLELLLKAIRNKDPSVIRLIPHNMTKAIQEAKTIADEHDNDYDNDLDHDYVPPNPKY